MHRPCQRVAPEANARNPAPDGPASNFAPEAGGHRVGPAIAHRARAVARRERFRRRATKRLGVARLLLDCEAMTLEPDRPMRRPAARAARRAPVSLPIEGLLLFAVALVL